MRFCRQFCNISLPKNGNRSFGSLPQKKSFARIGRAPLAAVAKPFPWHFSNEPRNTIILGRRDFSSTLGPTNELVQALSNELSSEESDFEIDPDLVEITEQIKQSFTIEDQSGLGVVKLIGNASFDENITITFDCQDEANMDGINMDALASLTGEIDNEDDDMDDSILDFGINFKVKISKSDGSALLVDCIAAKELQIEGVQYISSAFKESESKQDDEVYGGPVFDQLEDTLKDAFYEFLGDRKIDNDLAFFVLAYSRDKEQREYMHWLSNVIRFAS